jgi:DNA-binding GntR family transcriptional regulator
VKTKKIISQSINEKTYQAIKSNILGLEFPPGSRLQEEHLVNFLGVSKTPIKLALTRLEHDGLVYVIHRRGTFVSELTIDMAKEIYSLREVLEGLAARLATGNMTQKAIRELNNILDQVSSKNKNLLIEEYIKLDEKFHEIILDASNHKRLQQNIINLFDLIRLFKLKTASLPGRQEESFNEHKKIFFAIENHDPDKAETAMRDHVKKTSGSLLNLLGNKKILFKEIN